MDLQTLQKIKEETLKGMSLRKDVWGDFPSTYEKQVLVCGDTGCKSGGAAGVEAAFKEEIEKQGIADKVSVINVGCFGLCQAGPIAIVYPGEKFYAQINGDDVAEIVEQDIIGGETVEKKIWKEALDKDSEGLKKLKDLSFYRKQRKVATGNCGVIDPDSLEEYIAVDGYFALNKVLTEMTPEEVIKEISDSGLRGRGGGGFPTGFKWNSTAETPGAKKYVVVNADEGDPGAFMDRSILEGDPFRIIEAMAIAGYAIGSDEGYIYIRAEYPSAVKKLQHAIDIARENNLLGENILGTGFSFDVELRLGAGAFVCGEEMALLASIEGERGIPKAKPPFPSQVGLWGKPTLINNVETFANVPVIIRDGAEAFKEIGTEDAAGTKVFTLGGNVVNSGIIEVPMGTKLRDIIYEIGGGCPNKKEFKAVQTGGPSGGAITAENLDTPIEYKTLNELGSMMGSGGMVVMDEDTCMVDISRFYLDFTVDESCGKCTPCREGTKRLLELLEKITRGEGTMETIAQMEELGETIISTSLCGLGQSAPNPVLSTLRYFREEYEEHVNEGFCRAGVCKDLVSYHINDNCTGCTLCARKCPVDCISGERKELHVIDQSQCIQCGDCLDSCNFNAVERRPSLKWQTTSNSQ